MSNNPLKLIALAPMLLLSSVSASAADGAPAVTVTPATFTEVTPSVGYTGRVEAIDTVALRARVPGYLEEVLYTEGATVQKGDRLFVIEKGQYQAQVDSVKGAITRLEGTQKLAQLEQKRYKKLLKTQVASQDDYDRTVAVVTETQGDIQSQQAALSKAELDLSYTEVTAPTTGRISRSSYDPGDYVGPLSGDLATIVSQDPIYVTFPVSQRELLTIRKDMASDAEHKPQATVKVRLGDGEIYGHTGKVNYIDVASNPNTDTTLVRAEFPNPNGFLIHEQLVNVIVETTDTQKELLIPQRAIQLDQIGSYVFVVDAQGVVQQTRITTSDVFGTNVAISNGLNEGDNVIVNGLQKVRPGVTASITVQPLNGE